MKPSPQLLVVSYDLNNAYQAKGKMSAAGRARISAAAKASWAKAKAAGKKKL
jgi:hypothetical protein